MSSRPEEPRLRLVFGDEVGPRERCRIEYAFRTYCAWFGIRPSTDPGAPVLAYGAARAVDAAARVPALYRVRADPRALGPPEMREATIPTADGRVEHCAFPVFHVDQPADAASDVDWLGEAFEWLSGEFEEAAPGRDDLGRAGFADTLHGVFSLDPEIPYAAVAFHLLNRELAAGIGDAWPRQPVAPASGGGARAFVAATHDVDLIALSAAESLIRYVRNVLIAALVYRRPALVIELITRGLLRLARGRSLFWSPLDVARREVDRGFRASYYFICRREGAKGPNYDVADPRVRRLLDLLAAGGMELGVHGGLLSLDTADGLATEYDRLRSVGHAPRGGRQHWLSYRLAALSDGLVAAGAEYDCSIGYADRVGFRHGACFPFAPYDLRDERAFPVLELPLTVMDVALYRQASDAAEALARCRAVLDRAHALGWGGTSVLWHDDVLGGSQLPGWIADTYWSLKRDDEDWLPAGSVVDLVGQRYRQAGLLTTEMADFEL